MKQLKLRLKTIKEKKPHTHTHPSPPHPPDGHFRRKAKMFERSDKGKFFLLLLESNSKNYGLLNINMLTKSYHST
jgi:hypothetical protein